MSGSHSIDVHACTARLSLSRQPRFRFGALHSRVAHALSGQSRPVMCFEISAAQSGQAVFPMMFTHAVSGSAFPGSDASLGSSAVSVHARACRPLVSPSGLASPLRPEGQKRWGQRGVYRCKVSVDCTGAFRRRVPPFGQLRWFWTQLLTKGLCSEHPSPQAWVTETCSLAFESRTRCHLQ